MAKRIHGREQLGATKDEQAREIARLKAATTNGQLLPAFPTNWDARNGKSASWGLAYPLVQNKIPNGSTMFSARTADGVGTRIGQLILIGVGIFFMLLLLVYVAAYLFSAALMFVFLLMFAPFMLLTPAFRETGRSAFLGWLRKTSTCSSQRSFTRFSSAR